MSMLKYAISVMVATAVVHGVGCDSNNGRMGSARLVGSGASSLFSYFVFSSAVLFSVVVVTAQRLGVLGWFG